MAKFPTFPTYEEMAKEVADKVLDEFLYQGKTLREWIKIITEQDCISRAEALRQAQEWRDGEFLRVTNPYYYLKKRLNDLPSVKSQKPKIDVLDEIKKEISDRFEDCDICEWVENYDWDSKYRSIGDINDILEIIDKYKNKD